MGILGAYLAYIAGNIHGKASRNLVRGKEAKRKVAEALRKSPLIQEMTEQGLSKDEIMEKLNLRTLRGNEFERVTGIPWPL